MKDQRGFGRRGGRRRRQVADQNETFTFSKKKKGKHIPSRVTIAVLAVGPLQSKLAGVSKQRLEGAQVLPSVVLALQRYDVFVLLPLFVCFSVSSKGGIC